MGLFKSRPKKESDKERFLGVKLSEVRYNSIQELVIGEVSLNSDDSKLITINFEDERVVKIWVASDKVIAATDSVNPVDFRKFLFWIEASDGLKSILISEAKELAPDSLPSISTLAPALYKSFIGYSHDYTIEVLNWVESHFGTYTDVDTQIFKLPRLVDALANNGIDSRKIYEAIIDRREAELELNRLIGIAGVDYKEVMLELLNTAYVARTPEARLVLAASEAGSSLYDTFDLSTGFSHLKLLQVIKELGDSDVIDVSFNSDSDSELPELTGRPIKPYERVFVPTDLGQPLKELSEVVFAQSAWLDSVRDLVTDNATLEDRIAEIEDKLIQELSDESFVEFAELSGSVQVSVSLLLNEREAHNNKRVAILEKILENILVRESALDAKLQEVIDEKLAYIAAAIICFELVDLTPAGRDNEVFVSTFEEHEEFANFESEDTSSLLPELVDLNEEPSNDLSRHTHASDVEKSYDHLTRVERAILGIKFEPTKSDTPPPIFVQVAKKLGLDPSTLGK